jgi:hypothetical protein
MKLCNIHMIKPPHLSPEIDSTYYSKLFIATEMRMIFMLG